MQRLRWMGGLAVLVASGCQTGLPISSEMPHRAPVGRPAYLVTGAASTRQEFVDLCAREGIRLTESQLAAVAQATTILPNGRWAGPSSESAQTSLLAQWERNGKPAVTDPSAFLDAALQFARQRDATVGFYFDARSFRSTGQVAVTHWEPNRGQFLVLESNGAIGSYRLGASVPADGFVRIPPDLMPGAR